MRLLCGIIFVAAQAASGGNMPFLTADYGADPTGARDSTRAVQNALDSGGIVYAEHGSYKISSTLYFRAGSVLIGSGMVNLPGYGPDSAGVTLTWVGGTANMMEAQGIAGWGLHNIRLLGNPSVQWGIFGQSALVGDVENVAIEYTQNGVALVGAGGLDSIHNAFRNLYISVSGTAIALDGWDINSNSCYNEFHNLWLSASVQAIYLGWCDSNIFSNVHAWTPIAFNWSGVGPPEGNTFFNVDCPGWVANGSYAGTPLNYVYMSNPANGNPPPDIPGIINVTPTEKLAPMSLVKTLENIIVANTNAILYAITGQ